MAVFHRPWESHNPFSRGDRWRERAGEGALRPGEGPDGVPGLLSAGFAHQAKWPERAEQSSYQGVPIGIDPTDHWNFRNRALDLTYGGTGVDCPDASGTMSLDCYTSCLRRGCNVGVMEGVYNVRTRRCEYSCECSACTYTDGAGCPAGAVCG